MLTETLTLRGFDTVGAVCPTGSVFGSLRRRGETSPAPQRAGFFIAALQILISPPPLGRGYCLEHLAGLELTSEYLHQFLPVGPNPSPVAHQAHGAEQVPFDHESVEA